MQDGRLSIERVQMEGRNKTHSLVTGNITWGMLWFAVPMILGNLLQQFYNIADTLIVGRFLGAKALAAVGAAYTLMIFRSSWAYVWEAGLFFHFSTEPGIMKL